MREQVGNRGLLSNVFAVIGQVVGEFAVQLDLSLLDQLQNNGRRKLLGDRSESQLRVGCVWNVPLHVRESNPALVNPLAVLRDEGRAVKLAILLRQREHLLNLRRVVLGECSLLLDKSS